MNDTMLHRLLNRELYAFDGPAHRWHDYFGIELEIENSTLMESFGSWEAKHDGSLRNGVEFICKRPYAAMALDKAIKQWYDKGIGYTLSGRCSTHIHINMMDASIGTLRSMFFLMYFLEDGFYNSIGEQRKWAGYSMPLSEMGTNRIRSIMTTDSLPDFLRQVAPAANQERYYGFNTNISRHGTVEFRHFPGGPTRTELEAWLDFIYQVKQTAIKYPVSVLLDIETPEALANMISQNFSAEWVARLFNSVTPEQMFARFSEIAALSLSDEGFARDEPLVFLTPALKKYLLRKHGTTVAIKSAFLKLFRDVQVLTVGEFNRRIDRCRTAVNEPQANVEREVLVQPWRFDAQGGRRGDEQLVAMFNDEVFQPVDRDAVRRVANQMRDLAVQARRPR